MRPIGRTTLGGLIILTSLFCLVAAAPAPQPEAADRWSSFLQRLLEQSESATPDASALESIEAELVQRWEVQIGDQVVNVSAGPLQSALSTWRGRLGDADARGRVAGLAREMLAHSREAGTIDSDPRAARPLLARILAQHEFAGAGQPGWLDRLRSQFTDWLDDLLARLFNSPGLGSRLIEMLPWAILAFFLGGAVVLRVRSTRSRSRALRLEIAQVIPAAPRSWLREARAAAEAADWREAVRCSYWAAVSTLAERGIWSLDRARTHREYLRLLPAQHQARGEMEQLTRCYERLWYGRGAASRDDFLESTIHLERLGCPLNLPPAIAGS